MSKQLKKKSFTLHVNRNVLFEAIIKADSIEEALKIGKEMSPQAIWGATPGDIIDDEVKIVAVFES